MEQNPIKHKKMVSDTCHRHKISLKSRRINKRRDNNGKGGFQFDIPKVNFSQASINHSPDGAACSSCSCKQTSPMEVDQCQTSSSATETKPKWIQAKNILTAAAEGDTATLLELVEAKKTQDAKDDETASTASKKNNHFGLQMQLNSALLQAITGRHPKMVKVLLDIGADAEAYGEWYPLSLYAVNTNCEEIVDILIERGIKFSHPEFQDSSALHCAARTGNASILNKLINLKQMDINAQHEADKSTALHVAVQYGKSLCAQLLIEAGTDINIENAQKKTALHLAAARGNEEVVRRLISKGADTNTFDTSDKTPWFSAVHYGHNAVAEYLWKRMADDTSSIKLSSGKTLLHVAAEHGNINAFKLLLEKGCDLGNYDLNDNSPLTYAVKSKFNMSYMVKELLKHKQCVESINRKNIDGQTPLSIVLAMPRFDANHKLIASLLLKAGANINELIEGETLLVKHFDNSDIQEFLLSNSADPNIVSSSGKTVFWAAVSNYSSEKVIEDLLSTNVDLRITSHLCTEGDISTTPFTQAILQLKWEIAEKLHHAGCSLDHVQYLLNAVERKSDLVGDLTSVDIKTFLTRIGASEQIVMPMSLWNQSRLTVLAGLGTGTDVVTDKMYKLGLPPALSSLLHFRTFSFLRKDMCCENENIQTIMTF